MLKPIFLFDFVYLNLNKLKVLICKFRVIHFSFFSIFAIFIYKAFQVILELDTPNIFKSYRPNFLPFLFSCCAKLPFYHFIFDSEGWFFVRVSLSFDI
jgi:hypothetical protein